MLQVTSCKNTNTALSVSTGCPSIQPHTHHTHLATPARQPPVTPSCKRREVSVPHSDRCRECVLHEGWPHRGTSSLHPHLSTSHTHAPLPEEDFVVVALHNDTHADSRVRQGHSREGARPHQQGRRLCEDVFGRVLRWWLGSFQPPTLASLP